ncbi:hypothetical protein PAXRUDRAFT_179202 [Paxillus rubicundulus Ve08.2h10]|uniref:DUF4219 domain-containing protein n=1 Tax=Paxillus rubicundulus Ve08.2h10 TaxID=930991 RepID=A0A0D0CQN6_9AGAM|nr:hypothetical protein PAXRUDRAFT_179202 [Paxillus rubicundulus Ve08.2h10]
MWKYNHIQMLTGTENYHAWWTDMKYALDTEDLWCHISTGTNPSDPLDFMSIKPLPAVITQPTKVETLAIRKWLVDNITIKGFIHCFLSTPICQIVTNNQATTVCTIWDIIGRHYGCRDLSTQFVIHKQLAALHMKDAVNVSCYVGEHLSL